MFSITQVAATRCFPRRPSPAWVGLPLTTGRQPLTPPPVLTLIDLTGRFFPHVNPRPFRPGPVRAVRRPCQRPYRAVAAAGRHVRGRTRLSAAGFRGCWWAGADCAAPAQLTGPSPVVRCCRTVPRPRRPSASDRASPACTGPADGGVGAPRPLTQRRPCLQLTSSAPIPRAGVHGRPCSVTSQLGQGHSEAGDSHRSVTARSATRPDRSALRPTAGSAARRPLRRRTARRRRCRFLAGRGRRTADTATFSCLPLPRRAGRRAGTGLQSALDAGPGGTAQRPRSPRRVASRRALCGAGCQRRAASRHRESAEGRRAAAVCVRVVQTGGSCRPVVPRQWFCAECARRRPDRLSLCLRWCVSSPCPDTST